MMKSEPETTDCAEITIVSGRSSNSPSVSACIRHIHDAHMNWKADSSGAVVSAAVGEL